MTKHFTKVDYKGRHELSRDCPSVPEVGVGIPESLTGPVSESPHWPLIPRDPFSERIQTAPLDIIDLYEDGQNTDFPPRSEELSPSISTAMK